MRPNQEGCLFLGNLVQRFILDDAGRYIPEHVSGGPLFAAAAAKSLGFDVAILSRVGADFAPDHLDQIQAKGIDVSRVQRLTKDLDQRLFTSLADPANPSYDQPIQHFARVGHALPKALLDYIYKGQQIDKRDQRGQLGLREEDLSDLAGKFAAAHLCPSDFLSHELIPPSLRSLGAPQITLETRASYMIPDFESEIPSLVTGLKALISNRDHLKSLFGEAKTHWELIERMASFGCEAVITINQFTGIDLFLVESDQRLHIAPYPGKLRDLTFARSSFAGGFLAGLLRSEDLREAALTGAAAMSIATESPDPFYILDSFAGLISSRKENLALATKRL